MKNSANKLNRHASLEPVLIINEFERECESILEAAKKKATEIVRLAKDKAGKIIQEEKELYPGMKNEYLAIIEKEVEQEKSRLNTGTEQQLRQIQAIPEEKIKQAVEHILGMVIPK